MLSDVRAIAFDLDNTLWDVEPVLERAEQRLAAWLQQHCPRMALSRAEMRAAREQLARSEPHNAHDVSYLRVAALAAHARAHGYDERLAAQAFEVFLVARNEVDIFPDVAPALARLRRRYALASLSNGNADVSRIGLGDTFTVSLNARQIGAAKPERRCFERLAQELLLPAAAVAYVGDDPQLDVAAARAAGLRTVWMNRRALLWPHALPPADLAVSDCAQLAAALHT
ncbi:MAG TPA: HAD-IA family hydrolase [Steroidobacteraceae bacterium]|jgi:putative hydrolase of the HAD superfamily|nr:HAD-IA family hydrolase [Steroidobacteraceae bacterium]